MIIRFDFILHNLILRSSIIASSSNWKRKCKELEEEKFASLSSAKLSCCPPEGKKVKVESH
jgi:hypothetical protein